MNESKNVLIFLASKMTTWICLRLDPETLSLTLIMALKKCLARSSVANPKAEKDNILLYFWAAVVDPACVRINLKQIHSTGWRLNDLCKWLYKYYLHVSLTNLLLSIFAYCRYDIL